MTWGPAEELERKFEGDVRLLEIVPNVDRRGRLMELDFSRLPFPARRAFVITDVPPVQIRGGHSHREDSQLLLCIRGSVEVELRRGEAEHLLTLTPDSGGLLISPGVWAQQRYGGEGSALLVVAREPYDPADYEPTR